MAPLKRHDTSTLTTSDQEIPIATSDSMDYVPVRRSYRVSRSPIAASSSSRGRRPSVQAMRSPRVPTTIQTTPPRPPRRSRKGKGHRRTESVSEDPNMSLFRNPSYVAPELEIPSDCPEALLRPPSLLSQSPLQTPPASRRQPPRRRSPSPAGPSFHGRQPQAHIPAPPAQEEPWDDDDDEYNVQLPFTTETGLVYDYPPPNPEDPHWFEDMHGNLEADGYIKKLLKDIKTIVAARLYQSTIIELELKDLANNYQKMLGRIGQQEGKEFENFLRREAGMLVVPELHYAGVVRSLPRPQPQPQPQPRPQPQPQPQSRPQSRPQPRPPQPRPAQADENVFNTPNVTKGAPAAQAIEQDEHEHAPTEPAEPRSSSPISSPSNGASFRAQKRRIEAASSIESFVHFPTSKRRRTTPGPTFRYSPLPPSSPPPYSSSSVSGSPRPPAAARLSPIAEVEAPTEVGVVDSDPAWVPNDSNAENIDLDGHAVEEVVADAQKAKGTPLKTAPHPRSTPPEVVCARIEAIYPYYVPPCSSEMDIPMAWPPRSDEVDGEQDDGEPEAGTSAGGSVSAALARAKKGKEKEKFPARAPEDPLVIAARKFWVKDASPGPANPLAFRKYTRKEEEEARWPAYSSDLIS